MPPPKPPGGVTEFLPPVAFHFDVSIGDTAKGVDASFQEITGIDRELEVQPLAEGGENRFTHQLPKRGKHPNLVLKRGLVTATSPLADWAAATIGADFSKPVEPKTLLVRLLDAQGEPLVVWTLTNAYPIKWVTSSFNATENKIVVESIEMAYAYAGRRVYAFRGAKRMVQGKS